jgi:hypothetical protein
MNARGIAFISQRNGYVGEHNPPRIATAGSEQS